MALAALATLPAAAAGCGEVHFIPSPYTPQSVELIYSSQEHITVMRWRVSAEPLTETRFEMLGADGYQPIDFSQSVFPGGVIKCKDGFGTCAQYVVRGQYKVPAGAKPVQAVHDVYGVLPGGPPMVKTDDGTLSFASFFKNRNQMVYLNITDHVASAGPYDFPRSYTHTMWPSAGLCISDTPPSDVSFSPLDDTGGFPPPLPLTDSGTYCVAAQAVPSDGGDTTMVQVRIATVPETVTATQIFVPPVERSPIIYQIILDLEIPVPDRCADVIQKIESLTAADLVGGGVPVHKLPTINLAANGTSQCAQTNGRTLESAAMADQIKQLITTLDGKHQQAHLMYFNNLDAPLPMPLTTSIQSLLDALAQPPPGYELIPQHWMFAPAAAFVGPITWWAYWPWETTDDMFKMMLEDYGRQKLPYTSQEHLAYEPVALLSPADTTTYAGSWVKICSSSPGITPIATMPFQRDITDPAWKITTDDPPSYLVTLNNQIAVAATQFVEQSAIVNYQICTKYCADHPYVTAAGKPGYSWSEEYTCATKDE